MNERQPGYFDDDSDDLWRVKPAQGYAGDITPQLAHRWFTSGEARLIDIRTDAERVWVGFVPNALPLEWKHWPGMAINPSYDLELLKIAPVGSKAMFLCRSGIRSIAAAKRATELGLQAYNVLEGFEGDPDAHQHRGNTGGWRYLGFDWQQS